MPWIVDDDLVVIGWQCLCNQKGIESVLLSRNANKTSHSLVNVGLINIDWSYGADTEIIKIIVISKYNA